MNRLRDLLDVDALKRIHDAPLLMGARHPSWYPLFDCKRNSCDVLVDLAVENISRQSGGPEWLRDLAPRLSDFVDINNASSALAEIRAFGGLLEAGFDVQPEQRRSAATPDFTVDAGDGPVTVEVFSKHQDEDTNMLLRAVHDSEGPLPEGVERKTVKLGSASITTTVYGIMPAGRPDPAKPHDSIQANMISRVCGIKQDEKQVAADRPALLIIDFTFFGGRMGGELLNSEQVAPLKTGHHGITSGAIWYALYGRKGAPIFEGGRNDVVPMGHDGRFEFSGTRKTRLSAVLAVFVGSAVLLENPGATHRLTAMARLALLRYPWFELSRSIADWQPGCARQIVETSWLTIDALKAFPAGG